MVRFADQNTAALLLFFFLAQPYSGLVCVGVCVNSSSCKSVTKNSNQNRNEIHRIALELIYRQAKATLIFITVNVLQLKL